MVAFLAGTVLLIFLIETPLHAFVAEIALPFHSACLQASPRVEHQIILEALVCGKSLPIDNTHHLLQTTGLLHLMVVSGSHLIFLERLLKPMVTHFHLPRLIVLMILLGFTLASRAEPPVLRAFISLLLFVLQRKIALGWTPLQQTTISGFITLLFCHDRASYHSLLLSWTAALAMLRFPQTLSFPARPVRSKDRKVRSWVLGASLLWLDALRVSLRAYLFLLVALLPLALPHPLTILCNWLLAPVLGGVLFPLALLVFALPSCADLFAGIWQTQIRLLELAASMIPESGAPIERLSPTWLWSYLATLTVLLFIREHEECQRRRRWEDA